MNLSGVFRICPFGLGDVPHIWTILLAINVYHTPVRARTKARRLKRYVCDIYTHNIQN